MAVFSRRTVLMVLASIVILTVSLRYPLVEHERYQADSYFIHNLSQHLVDDGYARWTLHPLSYLGYYALSYPSGVPFLLGETSLMGGLSLEGSILLMGIIFGVLFVLAAFCILREFVSRVEFVLLATLLASVGPRFVDTTYWVASARGPLVVMMVLAIFVLYRSGSSVSVRKYIFISSLFVFGCLTIHHMAVLFIVFTLAYVIAVLSSFLSKTCRSSVSRRKATSFLFIGSFVVLLGVVILGYLDFFFSSIERNFASETNIFSYESRTLSIIMNLAVSYTHQMGFVLLFAVIAIPTLMFRMSMNVRSIFPMAVLLTFIPLIGDALYISMLMLPFVSVLAVLLIKDVLKSPRTRSTAAFMVALLVIFSMLLPAWSTNYWNSHEYRTGDTVEVDSQIFNDAAYLRANFANDRGLANTEILQNMLAGGSSVNFINSGIQSSLSGDVTRGQVEENISWSNADFPANLYLWFEYEPDRNIYPAVRGLMVEGVSFLDGAGSLNVFARDYFSVHNRLVVVVDSHWSSQFAGRWGIQDSALTAEMRTATWNEVTSSGTVTHPLDSYFVYQSERVSVCLLGLP